LTEPDAARKWQTVLGGLLEAFFSDDAIPDGAAHLASAARAGPEFYRLYLSALDAGIQAASRGEPEVLSIVAASCYVTDLSDAKSLLESIRAEYVAQYENPTGDGVTSQLSASVTLTREELLIVLMALEIDAFPGLEPYSEDVTPERWQQDVGYGTRSLLARGLAGFGEDGSLVVDEDTVGMVDTCVSAEQSLFVHHIGTDGTSVQYSGHQRADDIVLLTKPVEGLHRLDLLSDRAVLVEDILSLCECEGLPAADGEPTTVPGDVLIRAREAVDTGDVGRATGLLEAAGLDSGSARSIAAALADPHHLCIFVHVRQQSDDLLQKQEVSVLHRQEVAWAMSATSEEDDVPSYTLQPVSTDALRATIRNWLVPERRTAADT
jgi:hypothetical protein